MHPLFYKEVRKDLDVIRFLVDLMGFKQQNINLRTHNDYCSCTWQQLNLVLEFLASKFRKDLSPERYREYVEDQVGYLDGEIMKYCHKYKDISTLTQEQHKLKTEFDEIVEFYHEIGRMLHFAVFEKDFKENHDCRQFSRLKYAYIQKVAAKLQLYSSRLK